jgi:2-oxo-4-hydroxy-4-carboxy-5-ureidoimidazoline decarboxylase
MPKVTLPELNAADQTGFVAMLADIYEHAPWVAERAWAHRPFPNVTALHEAMMAAVRAAPAQEQLALINGHPDLAGKAALAGNMTRDSTAEQAGAGLDRLSAEEFARFHQLNKTYREKFAFPFIVCVRRHSKDSILRQFEHRLHNDAAGEQQTALTEIFRITALRLDARIKTTERLKVHGHLSTHILDTHGGKPAGGVTLELFELSRSADPRLIVNGVTNDDGRTGEPLIGGRPLPIGRYELRFHIGAYFARLQIPLADPPFLQLIPIQFAIAEPEGHYHVPLLVTPWSYTTYRGS